ncbi:tyrosine-type recombinase/integrase [Teredinibacter haidensis]|uniref:tyrosine-type recombinase/integrase n=1 Tax=Teredinibacter haidensis TaxID=2731755 RepID=UPI000948F118|nr:tyrosine-type recombinase/integrase [Teredinibacter haidensis]
MQTYKFTKDWLLKTAVLTPDKRTEYRDAENRFLRLVVHPSGRSKLCVYKCPKGSRSAVRVALPFSVNQAMPNMQRIRSEASQIIAKLDQGINPNSARKSFDRTLTLHEGLENYLKQSTNTPRVIDNWRHAVEHHLSNWLNKPLADICTPQKIYSMHRSLIERIAEENIKRGKAGDGGVGANEVMKKLRRVLSFNRALSGGGELPRWPAEELGPNGLKMWIEQKPRIRRIHREEFPAFWEVLHQLECPMQRDLFKFMLLTGCRSSEARGLHTKDVNQLRKTVTFCKTKNGKDHTLPLTATLHKLINERISESVDSRLFPVAEPKTVTKHIKRACGLHITPHDLRRTFAGLAEAAGIGSTTKKDLLNHLSGRDVTDDYSGRSDEQQLRVALTKIEDLMLVLSKT